MLHPGRAARVRGRRRRSSAGCGELHPAIVEALRPARRAGHRRPSSRSPACPAASRAVAQVDAAVATSRRRARPRGHRRRGPVPAAEVEASIRRHGGAAAAAVVLFDVYRGRPLGTDEKSLAYRLAFAGRRPHARPKPRSTRRSRRHGGLAADVGVASAADPPAPGGHGADGTLRLANGRCYPCAAPGRPASRPTEAKVDLGASSAGSTVDLFLALCFIGFFVLGFAQGAIRRLIGIGSILFSFLLAANIAEPLGEFLADNWTQFPPQYSYMVGVR